MVTILVEVLEKRKVSYKLYPSKQQEILLYELLRGHQQLYNAALQERSEAWKKCGKSISYADQCKSLTVIRQSLPEWTVANCSSQQMTLRRLDKAFKAFFRRIKAGETPGYPRFKSLQRYPGFSFKGHGDGWSFTPKNKWRHGRLRIGGVGHIPCRGRARQGGRICASDLLYRNGTWYFSLTVEPEDTKRERTSSAAVGIDWGVSQFLTIADEFGGHKVVENPRLHRNSADRIADLQRSVSRKKRGSNRRKKAVKTLVAARGLQARQRLDHLHKVSARLSRENALIAMEELNVGNMTRSAKGTVESPGKNVVQKSGLNREILDTAPALFTQLIRYKVKETGGEFVDVPTRKVKPSQTCPACGAVAKKTLAQRTHQCLCGHLEPRDAASARVNLNWALHGKASAPIRQGT
jgi:putative transposase